MAKKKKRFKLPEPGSPTALRRPMLASGARRKLSFEVTPLTHDLLRAEAEKRGVTQIMLLEVMIQDYCGKGKKDDKLSDIDAF